MYGKFFASAFTGSMFGAGADIFAVWGYVIANTVASQVELNPPFIAAAIGMTTERVEAAINALCDADPKSRSDLHEGRRLIREGQYAYRVPNHDKYRMIRCEDDRRAYNRDAQRKHRSKKMLLKNNNIKNVKTPVNDSQSLSSVSAKAEAEAYTEAKDQKKEHGAAQKKKRASLLPLPADFALSERVRRWAAEQGHSQIEAHFLHFVDVAKARAYVYADWDAALMTAVRKDWAGLRTMRQPQTMRPAVGKTVQAIHTLESMKHVNGSSTGGELDPRSNTAPDVPRLGGSAGGGVDAGDGDDLAATSGALSPVTSDDGF